MTRVRRRSAGALAGCRDAFCAVVAACVGPALAAADSAPCVRFSLETVAGPACSDDSPPTTYARAVHGGVIVGEYWKCGTSLGVAFIWHVDGTFEEIPMPPGFASMVPHDLNATTIVGRLKTPAPASTAVAFSYVDGVTTPLIAPPGSTSSNADAINDAGLIVGDCSVAGTLQPAQWIGGVGATIPLRGWTSAVANDVSDTGVICGYISNSGVLAARAFQLDKGDLTDAGTLFGYTTSAQRVNNHGAMVGYASFPIPDGVGYHTRGFLWKDGAFTIIEPPPGFVSCLAHGINDDGWVVGNASGAAIVPPVRGFLWRDGVATLLDDLIPPDSGLSILGALAIDAEGVIAASAIDLEGNIIAARLTPTPRVAADLDCDGDVDGGDLGIVLADWGVEGPHPADLNGDGIVDGGDVGIMLSAWGQG